MGCSSSKDLQDDVSASEANENKAAFRTSTTTMKPKPVRPISPEIMEARKSTSNNGIRGNRKAADQKAKKGASGPRHNQVTIDWAAAAAEKFSFPKTTFNGAFQYKVEPETEGPNGTGPTDGPISEGLEKLKSQPGVYEAIFYQSDMVDKNEDGTPVWEDDEQQYTLIKRSAKTCIVIPDMDDKSFTWINASYKALTPAAEKPLTNLDQFTDTTLSTYGGVALGKPLRPGRGEGVADVPGLSIIQNIDPNDVKQGGVGDCWLLSAISALAEFDGAIAKIFHSTNKKNPVGVADMPHDGENTYAAVLYDLPTWKPVEIVVDERLCADQDGTHLLSALPSHSGELWVCYLEKAIAAHCGGWDKLDGGQCTHAWSLLLGCKEVYTIQDLDGTGYSCWGKFNPNEQKWETLGNAHSDGFDGIWPMAWPEVGGGGDMQLKIDANALFERMCEWDDTNYIMAAGTRAGSDSNNTGGIVDGHAYTVIDCVNDVAGTSFDLIKVRNPWGNAEIHSGKWDDDGPGWDQYPEVKAALNPKAVNDGIFWLDKSEFFHYFKSIYLCAKDMTQFLED